MNKPILNSYRITDQIFAGEYPGDKSEDKAKEKFCAFSTFGITHFIDLTEDGELSPYYNYLHASTAHLRFPIRDTYIPESVESVRKLIKQILAIAYADSGNKIYIHCWGGVGRTGTIVGCLLAEMYGYDYQETLHQLNVMFQDCPKFSYRAIPENEHQRLFIAKYIEESVVKGESLCFSDLSIRIAERLKKRLSEWHSGNSITFYEWIWLKEGKFPFEYKFKGLNFLPFMIIKLSELDPSPLIKEMEKYRSLWESPEMTSTSKKDVENRIEDEMWRRIMDSASYIWGG